MATRRAVSSRDKVHGDEMEGGHGKPPEELYEEREKRIRDAAQLREPDRVPVVLGGTYFAARYGGLDCAAAYYDVVAWKAAYKKMLVDFEPDAFGYAAVSSGAVMAALGTLQTRWPGFNLPRDQGHQFVEGEYMKEDEYDLFLSDPAEFTLRCYLPRVFEVLKPLAKLPSPKTWLLGTNFTASTPLFATAEFQQLFKVLAEAGQEEEKWRQAMSTFDDEMAVLGFPSNAHGAGAGGAPFDSISDHLRGMRGSMLDMYRRPQKLVAACDKILEWRLERAVPADPKKRGHPKIAFSALHRGSEGFMSRKQFETFYWPTLKKAILASIDLGYVPCPFFEGKYDDRLEYLLELPKGSIIARFSETDMARAKQVIGSHLCLMGNVPVSLLQVGSPQDVDDYCKDLIKVCGKGGGFILRASTDSIEQAKPENVKVMVDSVKKYGWY